MYPGRGAGSLRAPRAAAGWPICAYHPKSTSGHTVHASAGTDALTIAAVAKPAEMRRWMGRMGILA